MQGNCSGEWKHTQLILNHLLHRLWSMRMDPLKSDTPKYQHCLAVSTRISCQTRWQWHWLLAASLCCDGAGDHRAATGLWLWKQGSPRGFLLGCSVQYLHVGWDFFFPRREGNRDIAFEALSLISLCHQQLLTQLLPYLYFLIYIFNNIFNILYI